ncbi:hypothetical protein [Bradyrhizobium sp. AZCC 2289]|uniref:hypothetical protein n=1 Tax=Bradyrhizobium sp. AZCC 2289 TaxID=3117026 RepID=UPI002FF3A5BF
MATTITGQGREGILPIFIDRGAPFAYKTKNIVVRGLFSCIDRLQDILAADDPECLVKMEVMTTATMWRITIREMIDLNRITLLFLGDEVSDSTNV